MAAKLLALLVLLTGSRLELVEGEDLRCLGQEYQLDPLILIFTDCWDASKL